MKVSIGDKFGKLIIAELYRKKNGLNYWLCRCDCENNGELILSQTKLNTGKYVCCGCTQNVPYDNWAKDLTNKKFGKLTAIKYLEVRNHKSIWLCLCDCGVEKEIVSHYLTNGHVKSCGCLKVEQNIVYATTHGCSGETEYGIWGCIKERCYNKNTSHYDCYGGRGIEMCTEWRESYLNFKNDMGQRPSSNHTLDRIDNDGNYCKENCRWATRKEQANNRRTNVFIEYNGETMTSAQLAEKFGFTRNQLSGRLRKNWTVEEALTIPIGTTRKQYYKNKQ